MARFSDRTAVITGAASGMGQATARRIASEGGQVVSIDIADAGGAATAELIERDGGLAVRTIECDVGDPGQVERAITAALAVTGRIDALINCAGTGFYGHFPDVTPTDVDRVMAVNFGGTFWACRYALDALLESKGSIVNIASAAGVRGTAYLTTYSASKGAVISFTRSLAIEYGHLGLRANSVCPGAVETPLLRLFTPPDDALRHLMNRGANVIGRRSTPDEMAGTIAFLASDDASQITGATVTADAGSTA
jgi:meso-butanediol dehydrogenase/(S,S)-butanediol dehydrogenase/diacetyl reductase